MSLPSKADTALVSARRLVGGVRRATDHATRKAKINSLAFCGLTLRWIVDFFGVHLPQLRKDELADRAFSGSSNLFVAGLIGLEFGSGGTRIDPDERHFRFLGLRLPHIST